MTTPDEELIHTLAQLRSWIEARPSHQETEGGCSCGWQTQVGRTFQDHVDYDDINRLYEVLSAPTLNAGSVIENEEALYAIIDARTDDAS